MPPLAFVWAATVVAPWGPKDAGGVRKEAKGVKAAGWRRSSSSSTPRRVVWRGRAAERDCFRPLPMMLVLNQPVNENSMVDLQSEGSTDRFPRLPGESPLAFQKLFGGAGSTCFGRTDRLLLS